MFHLPIAGFESLSLNNFTGRAACTVFTSGCNLRCRYCHNRHLVLETEPLLSSDELIDKLSKSAVKNISITGGEPLMHRGLKDFLIFLREYGFTIKLDTNGTYPKRLSDIIDEGLIDYIAIDIKGFDNDDFKYITRSGFVLRTLKETIGMVKKSNIDFELRYTVWKVPSEESVRYFFDEMNLESLDIIYLQRYTNNCLDKTFIPELNDESLTKTEKILKKYVSAFVRN